MNFDKNTFVPSAELNSAQKSKDMRNKEGVEIFSAVCSGKDLTKYGKKVDKVLSYMKNLGEKAVGGDLKAQAEINAIREIQIESPLLKRINLFNYMGDFQSVPYDTELRYKVSQLQGKKSGEQANSGSFAFPTQTWAEGTFSTKTITGGMAVDYRQEATMNTDSIAQANEQVITDMFNQMFYDVVFNMYNTVSQLAAAGGLTVFSEAAGINQAVVDDAIRLIRRWGNVTISGDYSVISQMQAFIGFDVVPAAPAGTVQYSEAVMEEIRRTGLLQSYRGANVVEIPNSYNLTRVNQTAGLGGNTPFFETYMPDGLLFLTPSGVGASPLQVGVKGGVTSMAGSDVNLRLNVQRFDIEFGKLVAA